MRISDWSSDVCSSDLTAAWQYKVGDVRILVIGATGVLGRPTVRQLVRQGHEVVALVKSAESAAVASFDGATPIIGSLFDERSVATAMTGCKAVMHLATRIPPTRKAHRVSAWVENERIRREGTDILVRVAGLCGVETFIYPSITLVYRDGGAELIEAPDAPIKSAGLATSTLFAERRIAEWAEDKRRAVILRLGNLYGPTSRQSREALALARRGWTVNPAADHAFVPYLWIDDASDALVRALDAPSGTYDVVEDGVLTAIDGRMALAAAVHRKRLRTEIGRAHV